ncbi:hypothetical protein [Caminibacter sp.]
MNVVLDDKIVTEIKNITKSNNLVEAIEKMLYEYKRVQNTKKIANDINIALDDVKKGKVYDLKSFLDEI